MANLVTVAQAKARFKLPDHAFEDADIEMRLAEAQMIVLGWIALPDDEDRTAEIASWTLATVPVDIRGAILSQFGAMSRWRGDGTDPDADPFGNIAPGARAMLLNWHVPVVS